ncbi:ferredoxin [Stutzerimonas stutzeri]|uniref:ferredoxin n=1 Tax=Stutzerimonas stutzeri TaxID=316 RepID=UPI00210F0CDB|nr:ferredoxin [Stutzerimonas stutzeri]MCQ4241775.1 ferredoxin [Stutzerimonas stutzeri]
MSDERVEVVLDAQKCQGYGLCLGSDDVFEMDSSGTLAVLKKRFVDVARLDEMQQLVRDCPAGAISCRVVATASEEEQA